MSDSLRLLSWNILQGGGSRQAGQLQAVRDHHPDIVCLQEVRTRRAGNPLLDGLASDGLTHQYVAPSGGPSENTLAIAARFPFEANVFPEHWPDRIHVVQSSFAAGSPVSLQIFSVHFPQKKAQVPLFDALLSLPGDMLNDPALILGDLNCGIPFEDSQTRSFVNSHMFQMLLQRGWIDSWRSRHPQGREFTWRSARSGNGFRYDHALSTQSLDPLIRTIEYDHAVRKQRLSDHSCLITELTLKT